MRLAYLLDVKNTVKHWTSCSKRKVELTASNFSEPRYLTCLNNMHYVLTLVVGVGLKYLTVLLSLVCVELKLVSKLVLIVV